MSSLSYLLRGGVTKKNRKIWGKFPKGGGGVKKTTRKFPISIWESEKPRREGVSIFEKFLNFSYL